MWAGMERLARYTAAGGMSGVAIRRAGPAAQAVSERDRLRALEREVKELRRANEILRKASAYFAQSELDRRGKW